MSKLAHLKRLTDGYGFPGFTPKQIISGVFGDQKARVITLIRRTKKAFVEPAEPRPIPYMIANGDTSAIFNPEMHVSTSILKYGVWTAVLAVV